MELEYIYYSRLKNKGELNMEEKRLGGGIITCAVLNIITYGVATLFVGIVVFARPLIERVLQEQGQAYLLDELPAGQIIISFIIMLLMLISTIIILCKKKAGVFAYFGLIVINAVYGVVVGEIPSIISFIIPALLAFFIYKKRSVFGFYDSEADEYMDA